MKYMKQMIHEYATWKWVFFIPFLFIYGWGLRNGVLQNAHIHQLAFNKWDIIIEFLHDPFLVIYFLLPFWLFYSSQMIMKEWDYMLLIRLKSYTKWVFYTFKRVSPVLFVFMSIWIIISLFVTIDIPSENNWSDLSTTDIDRNVITFSLQQAVSSPLLAFMMQVCLFASLLMTIHIVLATLYMFIHHMFIFSSINVFVFLGTIISFKRIPSDHWIQVLNYMFSYYSYTTYGSIIPAFLGLISIILGCYLLVTVSKKHHSQHLKDLFAENDQFVFYSLLCLFGIVTPFVNVGTGATTVWDTLFLRFFGVSEDGFQLFAYLFFCIVFLGFVYLFQLRLNQILNNQIYYLMIRYKSLYRWFSQLMKQAVIGLIVLLLFLFCVTIATGVMKGQTFELHTTLEMVRPLPYLLYQFFINGFLQVLNYLLIMFIVTWIWKDAIYGLILRGADVRWITGNQSLSIFTCRVKQLRLRHRKWT